MATKTKDCIVTITPDQDIYDFSAKGKNAIYIKGLAQDAIDKSSFRIGDSSLLFTVGGKSFITSDYTGIKYIKTDTLNNKTVLLDIIGECLVDNSANVIKDLDKPYYNAKKLTVTGTNYNDLIDYSDSGYKPVGSKNIKNNKGLTINGGYGNDRIIGTDYNDSYKGGVGKNTIAVKNSKFGQDVINLTKGEELIIDFKACTDIINLSDLKYTIVGKNLVITVPNGIDDIRGTLTLKNYTNNILKSLSIDIYNKDMFVFNNLLELVNSIVLDYDNSNLAKNGVLTATKYNDRINIENQSTKKYTIKAGNGENTVTVAGGKNVINSGIDTDTINISEVGNYTVNAGAGTNTININNLNNFGTVTINEQKVSAANHINFSNGLVNAEYQKKGNDLYIIDNDSQVIVKNYYATVKNKASYFINGQDIESYLSEQTTDITGSGKIYGTVNNDNIMISGKKAVTIYAGKGNDTIGASVKGSRTIYLSEGDGHDVIEKSNGVDTIVFQNTGVNSTDVQYNVDGTANLTITYGNNDTVTLTNYEFESDKRKYYKIGNKKYQIVSLIPEVVNIQEYQSKYDGTPSPDRIVDRLEGTINIDAKAGNDSIEGYNDNIYGGEGHDFIKAEKSNIYGGSGNDILINTVSENNSLDRDIEISGGIDDDTIINYGIATVITGEVGNDTITTSENSSAEYMVFNCGDGNDILYLDAAVNKMRFAEGIVDFTFNRQQDDLLIGYNNNLDSVIIKNYTENKSELIIQYYQGETLVNLNFDMFAESNFEDLEFNHDGNDLTITDKESVEKTITIQNFNLLSPNNNFNNLMCSDGIYSILSDAQIYVQDFSGSDYNEIMSPVENVESINGRLGNDKIINTVVVGTIRGGEGDDTIITEAGSSATSINFDKGDGHDTLYLNAADNNLSFASDTGTKIYSWSDDDLVISYNNGSDSVTIKNYNPSNYNVMLRINGVSPTLPEKNIVGTEGDDSLVSNIYSNNMYGYEGNDTIVNNAKVENIIYGGQGNDSITNSGQTFIIEGDEDSDVITNTGTVTGTIFGNDGNDTIINETGGTVKYIDGGIGDDIIVNNGTINVKKGYIIFRCGDGKDTLYLTSDVNKLNFAAGTGERTYNWLGDDLVIGYNSGSDSVTIKNYNPDNTGVVVNVAINDEDYVNLATLVPPKPMLMMMSMPMMSINELNSQVAAFSSPSAEVVLIDNNNQNNTDIPTLVANYS